MNTVLMGLLAETFVHVGTEQSEGVVDLPVAREAATDYPFIPGSGLKGALCDWAKQQSVPDIETLFGKPENAGQLLFSDARLLALPVRSLHGASRWITCPQLLERFHRDRARAGVGAMADVPKLDKKTVLGIADGERITLEERSFKGAGEIPAALLEAICELIPTESTQSRLRETLLILHDGDFTWFARYGLAVQARNVLDAEKKTSKNLWYEESLPPDSLLYTLIGERKPNTLNSLVPALREKPWLQLGGNETVGQGWFALKLPEVQS